MDLQQWNMPSLSYAAWNVYTVALREAHSNLRLTEVDEKIWLWRWHLFEYCEEPGICYLERIC